MSDDGSPLTPIQIHSAEALRKSPSPVRPQNSKKAKSYAQVATCVGQHVVGRMSGGLKPKDSKSFRISVRFSETEREILVRQAEKSCLTVSEYIRASVLGAGYISTIDPVKRQLLQDINRELSRQGNNLNQIAKHLNAGAASPAQGDSMLAMIARSLLSVHMRASRALAEGKRYE